MKWFRSNVKTGARLALFALTVQFAMSFGHFHPPAAQAASSGRPGPAHGGTTHPTSLPADGLAAKQSSPTTDDDHQPADNCAICAVMTMAGTVLSSTPPLLPLPQAVEFHYLTTDAGLFRLKSTGVAYQPRAPPAF
jgi:hypothetical protein